MDDFNITRDSFYKLTNYTSNHQVRSDGKGGGVFAYIHEMFYFKTRSKC